MTAPLAEALEALVMGDGDFAELERSQRVFCPFEAIGMVRQEIKHAAFLANALDPSRPHGFGSAVLEALLRAAAIAERDADAPIGTAPSPLDIHLMDLSAVEIRSEHRRIDLLAVIPRAKLIVAAELKIDASEHSGQLGRYRRAVEEGWPTADGWRHLLIFLTTQGDAPSDDGIGWLPVRMADLAAELDGVVARLPGAPGAPLLSSYLAMLRRHHLTDEKLDRIAARLWSRHREALEFLMERRPDGGGNLLADIYARRDEVATALSEAGGIKVVPDEGTPQQPRFAMPGWDRVPGMTSARGWTSSNRLLLMEVQVSSDRRTCRARMVIGPGPAETRTALFAALDAAMPNLTKRKQITGRWTRLATDSVLTGLDAGDLDPNEAAARIEDGLRNYAAKTLPRFDAVISSLDGGLPAGPPPVSTL